MSDQNTKLLLLRYLALRECMAYGTIASEVVTHRMLLQMCFSLTMEYTMGEPLKRPFHNNLEKCTVVNAHLSEAHTRNVVQRMNAEIFGK